VLRIFSRRLRPGVNPRTWVPKASTLPLDHRSRCPLPYNRIYFNTPRSSKLSFPLKFSRNIEHIFPSFPCWMQIYAFYTSIVINLSILFEHEWFGPSYHIPSTVSRSFRTSLFTCAFILFLYSISCLPTV
jgi:hypothetical protein